MSVVGFDLSQKTFRVATIAADKVAYIIKEIPSAMRFMGKQRCIGKATDDKEGLFFDIMKFIGKDSTDGLSCLVKNPDNDLLFMRLPGLDDGCHFTATHLLAMVLSEMQYIAAECIDDDVMIRGFCIGVPTYFTEAQRLAVRQASKIAGIQDVSIMNSTTAIALSAGLRLPFIWKNEGHIAIIDISDTITQVSIVYFKSYSLKQKATLNVKSYSCSYCLGENDFFNDLLVEFGNNSSYECRKLIDQSKKRGQIKLEFDGKELTLETFAQICESSLEKLKILVQKAIDEANLEDERINEIVLSGSGSQIRTISSTLENHFGIGPRIPADIVEEGVAMGCAMNCAIQRGDEFRLRLGDVTSDTANAFLINRRVIDKLASSVQDESAVVPISAGNRGRVELISQEISDATDKEKKRFLLIKLRRKLNSFLKLKDFMQSQEHAMVNLSLQTLLDNENEDLNVLFNSDYVVADDRYNNYQNWLLELGGVEERIMARKYEQENKTMKINELMANMEVYKDLFKFNKANKLSCIIKYKMYCRIKEDAKKQFKSILDETEQWLSDKVVKLATLSKNDNPIHFIADADDKIDMLNSAWLTTLSEREPKIKEVEFNFVGQDFLEIIKDYREILQTDEQTQPGCYLLPLQISNAKGLPNTWIHVYLNGRCDESVMLRVKRYNGYMMAFDNKKGIYELGDGRKDTKFCKARQLFPLAEYLGFHCDYPSMIKLGKKMTDDQLYQFLADIKFDLVLLLDSIHVACYHGRSEEHTCDLCAADGAIQRALMYISFMLNETARMKVICNAVHNGETFTHGGFSQRLMYFIWTWSDMSRVLREWDKVVETIPGWLKKEMGEETNLRYIREIVEVLYLVLQEKIFYPLSDPAPPPSSRGPPGDDSDNNQKHDGESSNQKQAPQPSPAAPGDGGDGTEPSQLSHGHSDYDEGKMKEMNGYFMEMMKTIKVHRRNLRNNCSEQTDQDGDKDRLSKGKAFDPFQKKTKLDQHIAEYKRDHLQWSHAMKNLKVVSQKLAEYSKMIMARSWLLHQLAKMKDSPAYVVEEEVILAMMATKVEQDIATYQRILDELREARLIVAELNEKQARNIQRIQAYLKLQSPAALGHGGKMKGMGVQILTEIFAVFVDPILADEISCILVHDDSGPHIIYLYDDIGHVEKDTPYAGRGLPYIENKIGLPLSGPWKAISSSEKCYLEFFPKEKNSHGSTDEISRRQKDTTSLWLEKKNLHCNQQRYNIHRYKTTTFGHGKVHVSYATWTEAVEADMKIDLLVPFLKRPNITGYVGAHHSESSVEVSKLFEQVPSFPTAKQHFVSRFKHGYISMGQRVDDDIHSAGLLQLVNPINIQLLQSIVAVRLGGTISFEGMLNVDGVDMKISSTLDVPSEFGICSNVSTQWIGCGGGLSYQVTMHLTRRFGQSN